MCHRRKRNKENPSKDAISQLPPPPEELQDELMVEAHPEVRPQGFWT